MFNFANIPELSALWQLTQGNADISVALLDGLIDTNHPCFEGSNLTRLQTLVPGNVSATGQMSIHGTHIASLIFGQPGSPVEGIAPGCRGIIAPIFGDERRQLSQLDLARAIEQAAENGAQVINISGGSLTDSGVAEDWLERAVKMCRDRNILIVAAAGNDGCECLHVPAMLPSVLAVGATDVQGQPLDYSNWGETYQTQGILAPGDRIIGAKAGGGTLEMSGTSFATAMVTGIVALLLSWQVQQGKEPNPQAIREALLATALPCSLKDQENHQKCLAGQLNIAGAIEYLTRGIMSESLENTLVEASGCGCGDIPETEPPEIKVKSKKEDELAEVMSSEVAAAEPNVTSGIVAAEAAINSSPVNPIASQKAIVPQQNLSLSNAVTPSQSAPATPGSNLIYALGTLGYDFGTEARRDSFKQLMPAFAVGNTQLPANPYDARQMVDYLRPNLSEARSLIWTLNLER